MYYDKEHTRRQPAFPLGQIVATANAHSKLTPYDIAEALARHVSGDWGLLCDEDWQLNDEALQVGNRLLSAYRSKDGVTFWIITEWDRSTTTILMPEDY